MLLLLPCLFSGGNFVGLVGRVWEELVSGGFCILVGNLFFYSPQIGGPPKVASLRVNRYQYFAVSKYQENLMGFFSY